MLGAAAAGPPGVIRGVIVDDKKVHLQQASIHNLDNGNEAAVVIVGRDGHESPKHSLTQVLRELLITYFTKY